MNHVGPSDGRDERRQPYADEDLTEAFADVEWRLLLLYSSVASVVDLVEEANV